MGGEEFMLIWFGSDLKVVEVCVNKLCEKVEVMCVFYQEKYLLIVMILVGVVCFFDNECDIQVLLCQVDEVFYVVKDGGCNQVCIFGEM